MTKSAHRFYIGILSLTVIIVFALLVNYGMDYYNTPIEERYFNESHQSLKPSGAIGHGLGIIGTLLILIGVSSYMARKRYRSLSRLGTLKYWLEFHIFLCTLGPILILFHTAFKFGGIVAISFWSMVAVFLSGIIGRFIYIQIPRTIEGRELSLNEVKAMKGNPDELIRKSSRLDENSLTSITKILSEQSITGRKKLSKIKSELKNENLESKDYKRIISTVKNEITLSKKIERLNMMQNLFKYWHVAHLPFALVMLVIMVIHVVVTIVFGYRWIF